MAKATWILLWSVLAVSPATMYSTPMLCFSSPYYFAAREAFAYHLTPLQRQTEFQIANARARCSGGELCRNNPLLMFVSRSEASPELNATERLLEWRSTAECLSWHTVTQDGVHLSRYCSDGSVFPTLGSRTQAKLAAHRGELLLNGEEARGHSLVFSGDELTLSTTPPPLLPGDIQRTERLFRTLTQDKPQDGQLAVLHEDADFAIVFKPPGIHTSPWAGMQRSGTFRRPELTLQHLLPLLLSPPPSSSSSSSSSSSPPLSSPQPAHRLDKRVGGVVAVAKTRRALAGLCSLFAERAVSKEYGAVVVGELSPRRLAGRDDNGVRLELLQDGAGEVGGEGEGLRIEEVVEGGKVAVTELRVRCVTQCGVNGAVTTLELRPVTGRRHQLRTACAFGCGAPIVGDDLYHHHQRAAQRRCTLGLPALPPLRRRAGLFLQARAVTLPHPVTGRRVEVVVPEAARFERLRRRAASGAEWSEEEWKEWRRGGEAFGPGLAESKMRTIGGRGFEPDDYQRA